MGEGRGLGVVFSNHFGGELCVGMLEWVFVSNQEISDKLIRVKIHGKGLQEHDFKRTLKIWHQRKKRLLKAGSATLPISNSRFLC